MRNWGFAAVLAPLAVCLWTIAAPAQMNQVESPTPGATHAPYHLKGGADPSYRVGDATGQAENRATADYSAHPEMHEDCYFDPNHDAADLCAQWQAAQAAQRAAENSSVANYLSGIALFVSSVGMIGLVFTLYQANLSLKEARKTAKAAEDSVLETRRIGEAQVRCYLRLIDAKVAFYRPDHDPIVEFTIDNSGQSPARNVAWSVVTNYSVLGTADRISAEISSGSAAVSVSPTSKFVVPPTHIANALNATELGHLAIPGNAIGVVVKIIVRATDVFRKEIVIESRHFAAVKAVGTVFIMLPLGEIEREP